VLRRREQTRLSSASDDEVSELEGAIRARDVHAADLQEEPTKRVENGAESSTHRFVESDEDGGYTANIAASGASHSTERAWRGRNQIRQRLGHQMPSSFNMARRSGRLMPTTL
jgi:hypothetical protein